MGWSQDNRVALKRPGDLGFNFHRSWRKSLSSGAIVADTVQLDPFDIQILRRLSADGRISVQDLSDGIGLSPTPTARRVRRLEQVGIITGYGARIDEAALGFDVSVFVSVQLDKQIDEALVKFETAIASFPEVVDCWLMTGDRDYLMRVATTGLRDFEAFLVGRLTKVEGVASIQSSIPIRQVKAGYARTP
ncbi:Lrp/AsnC family transcriptional regulator [Aliiroseovarius crassostreae]|nr:Lrp/AsnC family transcriptional regulator [Aliiroseovarius crassostreae]UWQ01681.1 Lrp/AsnC family transcriptional regulator [Aliiroseovarius crassostreae]